MGSVVTPRIMDPVMAPSRLAAHDEVLDDSDSRPFTAADLDPEEDPQVRLRALLSNGFGLPRSASEPLLSRAAPLDLGDGLDDPFAFSFSEDDLVPATSGWDASSATSLYKHVATDYAAPVLYSADPERDARISISRAPAVSNARHAEQPNSPPRAQSPPPSNDSRPPSSLARTITHFRRGRFARASTAATAAPSAMTTGTTASPSASSQTTPAMSRTNSGRDSGYHSVGVQRRSTSERDAADSPLPPPPPPPLESNDLPRKPSVFKRRPTKLAVHVSKNAAAAAAHFNTPERSPQHPNNHNHNEPSSLTPVRSRDSEPAVDPLRGRGLPMKVPAMPELRKKRNKSEPRKKDELHSVFRHLDDSCSKFSSKPTASKSIIVKNSLLSFLKTYADHPSNKTLHPEDLDRRAAILNKWWTALLDVLNVQNNHLLSGSERAILLEGISGIMDRPEWRAVPVSPSSDHSDSTNEKRDSHFSRTSSESDFLAESVQHNVRNTFIQSLFAQVVMVVDRMSLRHAPASMVAFCGKTCAFAFFFCPGIADILVRLWNIQPSLIKRVLHGVDLPKATNLKDVARMGMKAFPPPVQNLAFTSLREMIPLLRQRPVLPMGVESVQWYGHWVNRWSGRDSDLFYIFTKHYFALVSSFLPPHASKEEKACAPGYILVQAQLLANLDLTLKRGAGIFGGDAGPDPLTSFEDLLAADGSASALSAPPLNASRVMADNRLVMLMRDMFADKRDTSAAACLYFAETAGLVVKAAARSTSIYNHGACFTLCDFLQEAIVLLLRFQHSAHPEKDFLDWPFWLDVFVNMLKSQNTMSEIRLYSLLYTIWTTLAVDEAWKIDLCRNLLLDGAHFDRTFHHWCPMVRAYYMRLICWRIARFDGDASDAEIQILQVLMSRLQKTWRHFRFVLDSALDEDGLLPSTAPCNPAPGRRLLIIRTDTSMAPGLGSASLVLSNIPTLTREDTPPQGLVSGSAVSSILERFSSSGMSPPEQGRDASSKRSSVFKSILSYRFNNDRSRSQSPRPELVTVDADHHDSGDSSAETSAENSRSSSPDGTSRSRTSMYEPRPVRPLIEMAGSRVRESDDNRLSTSPPAPFVPASFKFSLEPVDRRPQSIPGDMKLQPPRVPFAAQMLLQSQKDFAPNLEPEQSELDPPAWTYTGRALAEWTLVVNECQNFFERRRNEGVPSNRLVETPILGVESFRRPG